MADEQAKLKQDAQKKVAGGWEVFHAVTYEQPQPVKGEYRAHRYIDNGTLVEVFGHTPEELAKAARDYDAALAAKETPGQRAARLAEADKAITEGTANRPETEEELASLAIEVQPVALAELIATEGEDVVTDEEKAKAGLTDKGAPKKGTHASIIPEGAEPEAVEAVTGRSQAKTSSSAKGAKKK